MHPSMFVDAVTAADEPGFESVWFPEHLVLPVDMSGFTVMVGATVTYKAEVEAFSSAGVDRLVVSPWARTRDVSAGLAAFARRFLG
jgi:alkanesulfonate monooxygenase SsuD/methylene tetrahydromethanopterin reductase-like flavin-dependent oxidoreductase (luciferase family)